MIIASIEQICPDQQEWLEQCNLLATASTLPAMVWVAMQMGLWLARGILETQPPILRSKENGNIYIGL